MANSFSASTIADIILGSEMLVLQNKVIDLDRFATNFSGDAIALTRNGNGARSSLHVDLASGASATQTNPTNYEQGDSTLGAVSVSMNEYSQPFHITPAQAGSGRKIEKLLTVNLHALQDKLDSVVKGLMTTANYGTAILTKDPTTVTSADIKTIIQGTGKFSQRNLVADASFWAQFAVTTDKNSLGVMDGAYGLDSLSLSTDWSGAGSNVNGFVGDVSAIAMAARLPENTSEVNEQLDLATIELPNGLVVQVCKWVSLVSRNTWNSFDVVFGAGVGDATAGKLIQSA
jgi:hypothetical protein